MLDGYAHRAILGVEIEFLCVLFSIFLLQSGKLDEEKVCVCVYNLRVGLSSPNWPLWDTDQKKILWITGILNIFHYLQPMATPPWMHLILSDLRS